MRYFLKLKLNDVQETFFKNVFQFDNIHSEIPNDCSKCSSSFIKIFTSRNAEKGWNQLSKIIFYTPEAQKFSQERLKWWNSLENCFITLLSSICSLLITAIENLFAQLKNSTSLNCSNSTAILDALSWDYRISH